MREIYFCNTGCMCSDGKTYTHFKIFDFENGEKRGMGFQYSLSGERYGHSWCHTESSEKISDISEKVLFSFYHGSSDFYVHDKDVKKCNSFKELISNSDFKFVSKEDIENSIKRDSIKTIDQIIEHWDFLESVGFGLSQAKICLTEVGAEIPMPSNGEIGILVYQIMSIFAENKEIIRKVISKQQSII